MRPLFRFREELIDRPLVFPEKFVHVEKVAHADASNLPLSVLADPFVQTAGAVVVS